LGGGCRSEREREREREREIERERERETSYFTTEPYARGELRKFRAYVSIRQHTQKASCARCMRPSVRA
jgi:hypothetical protein